MYQPMMAIEGVLVLGREVAFFASQNWVAIMRTEAMCVVIVSTPKTSVARLTMVLGGSGFWGFGGFGSGILKEKWVDIG